MKSSLFCTMPFHFVEIFPNGDIFPCCPAYCNNYILGNIFEQNFDEIWNGYNEQQLRRSMYHTYIHKYCNRNTCFRLSMNYLPSDVCVEDKIIMDKYPLVVKFSHDGECNYRCVTCRDKILMHSKLEIYNLDKKIDKYFLPLLKDAKIACLLGSGDPLASRHSRHLIKCIGRAYPEIRFALHTNGSLCTVQLLESLGIMNRLNHIQVSIHAACKQTYENITREGRWENILKNLDWIAKQHASRLIKRFDLIFVVTPLNVNEMTEFTQFAKYLGAEAYFWEYRWWGGKFGENFDSVNILSKNHLLYPNLKTQLCNISNECNVHLSPALSKIARNINKHSIVHKILLKLWGCPS